MERNNRDTHWCSICSKGFASRQSLCNHKKRCLGDAVVKDVPWCGSKNDDASSVLSLGTLARVVDNKRQTIHDTSDVPPKRSKKDFIEGFIEEGEDKRPDIVDCMGALTKVGDDMDDNESNGTTESMKECNEEHDGGQPLNFADDVKPTDSDNEDMEIQEELDAEDVDKVLPGFIKMMMKNPRKRIFKLLEDLKKDIKDDPHIATLEKLIVEFFDGDMTVNRAIKDVFGFLKTTARTVEMNNILNAVEDDAYRFKNILNRLAQEGDDEIPNVLKYLKRERLLSQAAYQKLAEGDTALSLQSIIKVLKAHPHREDEEDVKGGRGIIYLPGTIEGLKEKLILLLAEFQAGNTTTRNEIVAILDRLRDRNAITEHEYIDYNDCLGDDESADIDDIKEKLILLLAEYCTANTTTRNDIVSTIRSIVC